ncbi:hypothetical protein Pelo_1607 [Pelomyxa schiedti]|nr:hypothetical protein Pelo_1607 [Pelomyxa schiedti]
MSRADTQTQRRDPVGEEGVTRPRQQGPPDEEEEEKTETERQKAETRGGARNEETEHRDDDDGRTTSTRREEEEGGGGDKEEDDEGGGGREKKQEPTGERETEAEEGGEESQPPPAATSAAAVCGAGAGGGGGRGGGGGGTLTSEGDLDSMMHVWSGHHHENRGGGTPDVLEKGRVYFFYCPKTEDADKVESQSPAAKLHLAGVRRLIMVMVPNSKNTFREVIVGRKKLPEKPQHEKEKVKDEDASLGEQIPPRHRRPDPRKGWAVIGKVTHSAVDFRNSVLSGESHETITKGIRLTRAAIPSGQGIYGLFLPQGEGKTGNKRKQHVHLCYILELPTKPGDVQKELCIREEGDFIVQVKNPFTTQSPTSMKAAWPEHLKSKFNVTHCELLLIDASSTHNSQEAQHTWGGTNVESETDTDEKIGGPPDSDSDTAAEDQKSDTTPADEVMDKLSILKNDLQLDLTQHPAASLLEGVWQ